MSADIFRVTNEEFARSPSQVLEGVGGLNVPGRWHLKGSRVTYFASSRALGLLERLAHLDIVPGEAPSTWVAVKLSVSPRLLGPDCMRQISADELYRLDKDWRKPGNKTCLRIGVAWYGDNKHLLLRVPSAIIPEEYNTVVNCSHPLLPVLVAASDFERAPISIDRRIVEILDPAAIAKRRQR
ncbi:RES domain-containing protein [Ensifer sp. MPMI2T]|nr:RES domain-containing protein [Ensifer sp. MPMI2T]